MSVKRSPPSASDNSWSASCDRRHQPAAWSLEPTCDTTPAPSAVTVILGRVLVRVHLGSALRLRDLMAQQPQVFPAQRALSSTTPRHLNEDREEPGLAQQLGRRLPNPAWPPHDEPSGRVKPEGLLPSRYFTRLDRPAAGPYPCTNCSHRCLLHPYIQSSLCNPRYLEGQLPGARHPRRNVDTHRYQRTQYSPCTLW